MAKQEVKLIISTDSSGAITGLQKVSDQTKKIESDTASMVSRLKSHWLGVSAAIAAAAVAVSKAWDFAEMAAQFQQSKQAFNSMIESMGADAITEFSKIRQASAGLIDNKSLVESANRALSLGIPLEKISSLMEISRAKSRDMGITMTQAFNDIAIGIGRGSPLILDNLGLSIKLGEANETLAAQLGKTADQLTDNEKKTALLNAIIDAGKEAIDRHNLSSLTMYERMQKINATVENMKLHLGALIIRIGVGLVGAWNLLLSTLSSTAATIVSPLALIEKGLNQIGIKTTFWQNALKFFQDTSNDFFNSAGDNFKSMIAKSEELVNKTGKTKKSIDDLAGSSENIKKLNIQLRDLIDKETLSKMQLLNKQAQVYRDQGADEILIKKWVSIEKEKIDVSYFEKNKDSIIKQLENEKVLRDTHLTNIKAYRDALINAYNDAIAKADEYYNKAIAASQAHTSIKDFFTGFNAPKLSPGEAFENESDRIQQSLKGVLKSDDIQEINKALEDAFSFMEKHKDIQEQFGVSFEFRQIKHEIDSVSQHLIVIRDQAVDTGAAWEAFANQQINALSDVDAWITWLQTDIINLDAQISSVRQLVIDTSGAEIAISRLSAMVATLNTQIAGGLQMPITPGEDSAGVPHDDNLPGLATGTNFVPYTGIYKLHQGEAVIPAAVNKTYSQRNVNITLSPTIQINSNKDGRQLAQEIDKEISNLIKYDRSKILRALQ